MGTITVLVVRTYGRANPYPLRTPNLSRLYGEGTAQEEKGREECHQHQKSGRRSYRGGGFVAHGRHHDRRLGRRGDDGCGWCDCGIHGR